MKKITGTITLASGEELEITDENLVANSLTVRMSTCGSRFDIGSFNAAVMTIGILDESSLEHDFGNAKIELTLSEKEKEDDPEVLTELGAYYVTAEKIKRLKNRVTLSAQDGTVFFDRELPDSMRQAEFTPFTAITAVCGGCGVGFALTAADLEAFPNYGTTFTLGSKAVQTYRDVIMWIAQLLCANAVIDRDGRLTLRSARYKTEGGIVTLDDTVTADMRTQIRFSDSRIVIKYLTAYSAGRSKNYISTRSYEADQLTDGSVSLLDNPILAGKSESECDEINSAYVTYLEGFAQRGVVAKVFSGAKYRLGETLAFVGGDIDLNRRLVGIVTAIDWRYSGLTTITCTAPQAERSDTA